MRITTTLFLLSLFYYYILVDVTRSPLITQIDPQWGASRTVIHIEGTGFSPNAGLNVVEASSIDSDPH
ncbi:hypothetical protein CYY_010504 [Polysphondylium violaceum]|uniref:IPT/TIG domain-containing protein n=1 Tax=Polysphondylium violaceum TaxID=133409 RepID=A0A8J4PJ61_9MYCE|nr:hypothetical protein CYY_010504 [Polysphondylium violaceum]